MKSKFIFLFSFLAVSITHLSANMLTEDHGSVTGGGGLGVSMIRSVEVAPVSEVRIINSLGQEIDRVPANNIDLYSRSLAPGQYTFIYVDSDGNEIYQVPFLAE